MRNTTWWIAALMLAGCGSGYSAQSILDRTPQGSMEGTDWTMGGALVRHAPFTGGTGDVFSVQLFAQAVTDCTAPTSFEGGVVLFQVPSAVGEYPLRLDFSHIDQAQVVTFSPSAGENFVATQGLINVTEVSTNEVAIGVIADAERSSVNGRIRVPICP